MRFLQTFFLLLGTLAFGDNAAVVTDPVPIPGTNADSTPPQPASLNPEPSGNAQQSSVPPPPAPPSPPPAGQQADPGPPGVTEEPNKEVATVTTVVGPAAEETAQQIHDLPEEDDELIGDQFEDQLFPGARYPSERRVLLNQALANTLKALVGEYLTAEHEINRDEDMRDASSFIGDISQQGPRQPPVPQLITPGDVRAKRETFKKFFAHTGSEVLGIQNPVKTVEASFRDEAGRWSPDVSGPLASYRPSMVRQAATDLGFKTVRDEIRRRLSDRLISGADASRKNSKT